ncbi:SRPBCC domain-containing protein [Micromonospora pattaloongensis]|uniref:SRPBCC domain-containing protein n=1 Tax=Micromonospora pattaloongensis TaxID=405436 RepID=UPI000B845748|nr:SRPBCC domain-containing protein [Micromonospora pattaloongensis]
MTEIRMDVELEHPPERVWRALTDRHLLPKWFAETDLEPRAGSVFRFEPITVPGLPRVVDGELISLDEPRRLSMRWRADDLQTLVAWELTPTAAGCRLTLRESCVREQWDPEQRAVLEEGYRELYTVRLPAVLDWIAFREVDFAATVPGGAGGRGRRGGRLLAGVAAVVAAALAMVALTGLLDARTQEPTAAAPVDTAVVPNPAGSPSPGASTPPPARGVSASLTPSPSQAPRSPQDASGATTSTSPTRPAGAALLGARYATVGSGSFGYDGEITVSNTGSAAASGWTVTVTLPPSPSQSKVLSATGARHEQRGRVVTFTGGALSPGGTARFRFEVGQAPLGEKAPAGCTIAGRPCAGL